MLICSSIFLLSALVTSSFSWLPSTFKGSRVWRPSSNDQKRSLASFRSKFGYRNLMEKRSPVNPASLFRRQSRLVEIFGMQLSEKCVKECCEKQQRDSSQGCSVSYFQIAILPPASARLQHQVSQSRPGQEVWRGQGVGAAGLHDSVQQGGGGVGVCE